MSKKAFTVLFPFFLLVLFVSIGYGQSPKKTITLPNGDVVCDLNGEWDAYYSFYGEWGTGEYLDCKEVVKITQNGAVFVGVKQSGGCLYAKGAELIRGDLSKRGLSKAQIFTISLGSLGCSCEISQDGSRIILDHGDNVKVTLTRR